MSYSLLRLELDTPLSGNSQGGEFYYLDPGRWRTARVSTQPVAYSVYLATVASVEVEVLVISEADRREN